MLLLFQTRNVRVVLVLDRFDNFCQVATPQMADTLRGLRDSFKDTLCFIVGMRQEVSYLSDPSVLGELYELLDSHVCWVGPMSEADARQVITQETHTAQIAPTESDITTLLRLTGGYPALLKASCHWLEAAGQARPPVEQWPEMLLAEPTIQFRLAEIWEGQSQEEQLVLSEVQKLQARVNSLLNVAQQDSGLPSKNKETLEKAFYGLDKQHHDVLIHLAAKGLCQRSGVGWRIFADLFTAYIATVEGRGSGKIWLDHETDVLYQDQMPVEGLSPLERAVLHYLVQHPRTRHTKTDLIINSWPDELRRQGVTDDSLYQVVSELRKKIEPNPVKPCYIVTWRGKPEGGYQFFPEGRPG
jgi:DNA-binding response OmpR family regulator